LLKALFTQKNITIKILNEQNLNELSNIHNIYDGKSTCINCHTLGNNNYCPRLLNTKCVYINYDLYNNYDNYKLNAFDDYYKWEKYYKTNFLLSFYTYYNLTFKDCINNMNIKFIDKSYDNNCDYIVKHSDPSRRLNINLNTNLKIIELNNLSKNMIDTVNLINHAKEIHVIDSNYSVMIMLLQKKYNLFNNIPIFLYNYPGRDNNIYFDLSSNWSIKYL
jgi:hypothetical protein